jgi:hypothetical protein
VSGRSPGASKHTFGCSRRSGWCATAGQASSADGLDARGLRRVHEWSGGFERFWDESFDRLDAYVQNLKQEWLESGAPA